VGLDIVMPFYGDPFLLEEAIVSVLAQSNPNWTLTIIDDAYPEPVAKAIVSNYPDPRISFIRNQGNQGVSGTFQQALNIGTRQYLVILGCDDRLLPNYVNRVLTIIQQNPGITYIQPGVMIIDENGREYSPLGDQVKKRISKRFKAPRILSGDNLASSLLSGNWTYFPSICWNRDAISKHGFRQDMQIVLDLSLQLDLLFSGGSMYLDNSPVFEYRRHKSSASSWTAREGSRFKEEKALFHEAKSRSLELGWDRSRRAANLHLTSRLNAITHLPHALFSLNWRATCTLLKHALCQ
jgi:glycosyltransferase involved in cell wall biosynthesis